MFREEIQPEGETNTEGDDQAGSDPIAEIETVDDFKGWTPEAARRFKELKTELKTYKTKTSEIEAALRQRETRVAELEAIANDPEYSAMRSKIEEYENGTLLNRLEQSSAYRTLVTEPIAELVSNADEIASRHGIEPDTLLEAIAIPD